MANWGRQLIVTLTPEGCRTEEICIMCVSYRSGEKLFQGVYSDGAFIGHHHAANVGVHIVERPTTCCGARLVRLVCPSYYDVVINDPRHLARETRRICNVSNDAILRFFGPAVRGDRVVPGADGIPRKVIALLIRRRLPRLVGTPPCGSCANKNYVLNLATD